MDGLQRRAGGRPLAAPFPAACTPRARGPLYAGRHGLHRFRGRYCQAGEILVSGRAPARWRLCCRHVGGGAARSSGDRHTRSHVVREYLPLSWISGVQWSVALAKKQNCVMLITVGNRLHALRRAKDPSPREVSGEGFDHAGCSQREHQLGVGLSQHFYKDGTDPGNEGE